MQASIGALSRTAHTMEAELTQLRVGLEHHQGRLEVVLPAREPTSELLASGGALGASTPIRPRRTVAPAEAGAVSLPTPTVKSLVSRLGETNLALQARLATMHSQRALMTPYQTPSRSEGGAQGSTHDKMRT